MTAETVATLYGIVYVLAWFYVARRDGWSYHVRTRGRHGHRKLTKKHHVRREGEPGYKALGRISWKAAAWPLFMCYVAARRPVQWIVNWLTTGPDKSSKALR